jgi:CRISPR/Cas system CSM-associated protein Csm3 (group 7 of RAMP superfamily)
VAPDSLKPLAIPEDKRSRVVIDLDLKIVQDILVRSAGTEPGAPDVSHLNSGGRAILPGTSLAGVMRSQALRIAKLVRAKQNDADTWINRLFGRRFEGRRPTTKSEIHASRLRIGEAAIDGGRSRRQTRVAIDRFTGGAADTALFDEQTEVGGHAAVRLELRNPKNAEIGLVLLVLKDLLDGTLPVGGTSSVGRGVLRGYATVTWYEVEKPPRSAKVEPGSLPTGEANGEIDRAILAFHEAESPSHQELGADPQAKGDGA